MNTRRTTTQSRIIQAPIDQVAALLADIGSWSRWGPVTDAGVVTSSATRPVRYGRTRLRVKVVPLDAPFWLRVHVDTVGGWLSHTGDVTLSPLVDGRTRLSWRATLTGGLPDVTGRRRARLERAVFELAGYLASYAEDSPTTRLGYVRGPSLSRQLPPCVPVAA